MRVILLCTILNIDEMQQEARNDEKGVLRKEPVFSL